MVLKESNKEQLNCSLSHNKDKQITSVQSVNEQNASIMNKN